MPTKAERERDGAIKFGEAAANQAMMYASKVRDLRRAMLYAINHLKTGRSQQALQTLREALIKDNQSISKSGFVPAAED